MRLLVVTHSLDAGGTQRFLANLCHGLALRGVDLTVVTLSRAATPDFFDLPVGVKRVRLSVDRGHGGTLRSKLWRDVTSIWQLRRVVRSSEGDVVLSLGWSSNVVTLLATRFLRLPVVISERVDPRKNPRGRWWAAGQRLTYPFATHLVTQTTEVEDLMRGWVRRGRVSTIGNPVPSALFEVVRELDDSPHVVSVCRLTQQKGVDVLLRAFAIVRSQVPDAVLSIVGDGSDRLELEELAAELGIEQAIQFHGMLDDPTEVTRRAWCGCLASRNEGFPNALIEMMAQGIACVSTDCPSGPGELLRDGAGLLVPVDDHCGLATNLVRVLRSSEERAATGEAARRRAEEFRDSIVIDQWHSLLVSKSS